MPHHKTLQHGGFATYPYPPPAYPSSTDSDSMDSFSAEVQAFSDQNQNTEEQFLVGDLDLEQLDPWRRNVHSPIPRITDTITQALAEAALSPLSPTLYSPWDGDFAPPPPGPTTGLNEYANMQAQARGRGPERAPPPQPIQPPTQSQPPPQYREERPLQQPDIYYPYSEASTSLPTPHTQSFAPMYMAHNPSPSPTVPHHHHQHRASSMTAASSPTPLSDAEAEAKRIRNTAASARFRRKKKAREASLERQSREKREALAKLENRITELEDENKFLKGLILWKREGKEEETNNGTEESIVVEPERKGRERKDGVGT